MKLTHTAFVCVCVSGFRLSHTPNDAVQTVDLLVGVGGRRLLLHKRRGYQSFGRLCHVCYQTSDGVAVDGSEACYAWRKR